ncbi:PREDICTED: disintegrin and metalloproteinase domain-containing protein 1b-like [Propithecus coquereli]|uniref:disintegrin and metalloproteinase domain-containing protein 1b-like n=1 Tax=Propithecus coquereli TaxID=379532 RepID=UPI00063FC93A|nr:PREDICTED: disintegrin and metalloproteinase domain-containing protein 1b-like [Propithecus coquereli]
MKAQGLSCVRLGNMLLLGMIFLPSIYCDMESVYYSSYEIVIPKSLTGRGSEDPIEKASYVLFMQGQKYLVHLKVKRDYFVNNFPVYSYHNGMLRQELPFISHDCHYEGYIEGVPGSFVSVNTCSGLRGILIKEEKSYGIEPMDSSKQFEHVLYTMAHQVHVSCSVTSKDSQAVSTSWQRGSRKPHHLQALSYLWSHAKYVEMFVVVNNQRFQMWGSNISETVQRVVDIVALANSFTRGINTEVVLAGMEIWTEGDLIEVPVDLQVTLRNFNSWRREKLFHRVKHDVAHMIVGHHPGESMGQAFLNGACSSGFAAAVESFHHEDILLFAALMVHELGHNLGIQHDHSACMCKDRHFCLMHENITKQSGFSNCSSDYFYHFLREHKGACLFNKPWHKGRKRRDPSCGNGEVEEPEECDCGSACDQNPCCDSNCKLKENAQCSEGLCCASCQLKLMGNPCRDAEHQCDLTEYCDGTSASCPEDRTMQDGSICNDKYLCLQGVCVDPNIQCAKVFGDGAQSASRACYSLINGKGDRFGNCGCSRVSDNDYVRCTGEDVLCGKLVCTGIELLPTTESHRTMIQVPLQHEWCWSLDAFTNVDIPDEGDVLSGTYCGPRKVCLNFSCTDYSSVSLACDPETTCNKKGVCNDLGHCHCESGYAPPDCTTAGQGGSVDSGPAGKPTEPLPPQEGPQNVTTTKQEEFTIDVIVLFVIILLILLISGMLICFMGLHKKPPKAEEAPPPPAEAPSPAPEKPEEAVEEAAVEEEAGEGEGEGEGEEEEGEEEEGEEEEA